MHWVNAVPHTPSSPLEGEPNPFLDLVGGNIHANIGCIISPHRNAKVAFRLPLKGGVNGVLGT